MLLAHLLFEIHGNVEDAGDFDGVVTDAEKEHVAATTEGPAIYREIFSGFASGEVWICTIQSRAEASSS